MVSAQMPLHPQVEEEGQEGDSLPWHSLLAGAHSGGLVHSQGALQSPHADTQHRPPHVPLRPCTSSAPLSQQAFHGRDRLPDSCRGAAPPAATTSPFRVLHFQGQPRSNSHMAGSCWSPEATSSTPGRGTQPSPLGSGWILSVFSWIPVASPLIYAGVSWAMGLPWASPKLCTLQW